MGLRCGIEIHQQLDTKNKLFCDCSTSENNLGKVFTFKRMLHTRESELGEVDMAAIHEAKKGTLFIYHANPKTSCLVELDEEPPHDLNTEALKIAVQACILLNCRVFDELHVMRKIVIDGSNTSGFQRTVLVGTDGWIEVDGKRIEIKSVCLEEDSARILRKEHDVREFSLDRLGIPLIEITTGSNISSSEEARKVAEKIGTLLRSLPVKRGLGTIRQDINVSTKEGARVEIKGVQELSLIPKVVEYERDRQESLARIASELKNREIHVEKHDVSEIFKKSNCKVVSGKSTWACVVGEFKGYFARKITETKTMGKEVAEYVKAKTGIKGIIHSDENIEKYGLSAEFSKMRKLLKAKENDLLVIAAGKKAEQAIDAVMERVKKLKNGVLKETRRALGDGNTEYMRPLPGASRMYPETDVRPIRITREFIKNAKASLPETLESRLRRYEKVIGRELAAQVVKTRYFKLIDEAVKRKLNVMMAARIVTSMLKEIKREGISREADEETILRVLEMEKRMNLSKEMVYKVLKELLSGKSIEEVERDISSQLLGMEEVERKVREVVERNKELVKRYNYEKIFMGMLMKEFKGKVDGKVLIKILRRVIDKKI